MTSSALAVREVAKPWGRQKLPPPFARNRREKIGELWFEPPCALDQLLIKYIFTSEDLSVQVHPSDAQTLAKGLGKQGKEECWLVIDAEPGATLGIGFRKPIGRAALRAAALDGSIKDRIHWYPVSRGDFFYIPANTVHAIGAGVSLIEVQQNSDITYRLFDYGRPRELHLDEGMAVADGVPYDSRHHHRHVADHGTVSLVNGPHFRLDRVQGEPGWQLARAYAGSPLLVVPLDAEVFVSGEAVPPGGCAMSESLDCIRFAPNGTSLIARPSVPLFSAKEEALHVQDRTKAFAELV